jgi:tetratricopeptide (TPR) repeat protein
MEKLQIKIAIFAAAFLLSFTCQGSAQLVRPPASDIDWRLCAGELRAPGDKPTLDERLSACTRIIDRGERERAEIRTHAHEYRGSWLEQKGDLDQAIAEYFKGPRYFLHFTLCRVYAAKRDFDQAITNCSEAGNLDLRGKLYFVTGKYGDAASDLLFGVDPFSGKVSQALWRYIVHQRAELVGDPLSVSPAPTAVEELDADARELNKTIPGFQFIDLFLGRAQWDDARRPVMDNPCDTSFFTGELHLLKSRQLEAERSLQQVLDSCGRQPKQVGVYLVAQAELARITETLQYEADQLLRDDRDRRKRAAQLEQLVHAQNVIIQNETLPAVARSAAHNVRGRAYLTNGDAETAIADFSQAIALDHSQAAGFKNRCAAYAIHGDIAAAVTNCTAALELDQDQSRNFIPRGELHFIAGDYAAAASDFSKAREQNPNDPIALVWLDLANDGSDRPSNFAREKFDKDSSDCRAAAGDNAEADYKSLTTVHHQWPESLLAGGGAMDRAHFCEAQFYVAEAAIRSPILVVPSAEAKAHAQAALKKATASHCSPDTYEFLAAQAELRRLDTVLQGRSDRTRREAQQRGERITRFKESMPKIRSEAEPIVFEYNYFNSAWGYANLGCFINASGALYVYNSNEDPGVKLSGSVDPGDFARAIEMAKAIGTQKLSSAHVAFDAGVSAWTVSVGGTTTELKVAGEFAGEMADPKATELIKVINRWCPAAAAAFNFAHSMNAKCTQTDDRFPIWICK